MLAHSAGGHTNDTDKELAEGHANSTPNKDCATTVSLNNVEGNRSRANINQGSDETNEERIRDRSQFIEESSTKVEDEVDTGPSEDKRQHCFGEKAGV